MKTLCFIFILCFLASFLYATIINVPDDQTTIQAGITAATNTDTVLVQPDTYMENINYNGKLVTVASLFLTTQDPSYISSTIIDGNSSGSVVTFENSEDSTAVLCGFTITDGLDVFGGGIYCGDSSPSLISLEISGNSANNGGGISCYNSNPYIKNLSISDNSSAINGGGIYLFESNPSLKNVVICSNTAEFGGGISCSDNSNIILLNVTISGNTASNAGGGIECYNNSNPNLANCILWNDSPQEIFLTSSSITATYSDIEGDWTGIGNIDSDPLFVDAGIGDYHLQATSPCIDEGNPTSTLDPDGTITDMGAFYYNQYLGPVWYISTTGSDLTGTGTELFPFATIQHGIDSSSDTDTVLVQPGTYFENMNFNGKLITVGSLFFTTADTSHISSTIIDGDDSGSVVTFISGENSNSILCGFTITNGQGGGSYPDYDGGGITCRNSSSPRLENLIITGNTGSWGGGLFCYWYSNPIIENVVFSNNDATSGGGICCFNYTSPNLQSVIISDNTANYGGGMTCYPTTCHPSLQNVLITGNHANVQGGGIGCEGAVLNLESVTITGNSATNNAGGMTCENNSNITITNSIVWNNSLEEIYITLGSVTVNYSDIEGSWTGTGNINSNPMFVDSGNDNFNLLYTSPCIDTGNPLSPLDPDGTRADMGAYYFDHTIALDPPQNVVVEIIGTDVHLSWDAAAGANSYKVYSSDDPYSGFMEDTSGAFDEESWNTSIVNEKKFYYVISSTVVIR